MLNNIINYSLKNRLIILIGSVIILVVGAYISSDMDVDIFPDLNAPTVVVMTEAHGMAPEEVERLVSFPIETAVNGAANIRRVRSSSAMGFSIVWVEFDWGTNIFDARQTVSEKLNSLSNVMPKGVEAPMIAPQSSLLGEVMLFSITSDTTDPITLRTIADWNIRPLLLSIGGVAQVTIIGGDLKQYQINADPDKLRFYNISFFDLVEACDGFNENVPGGYINQFGNQYIIRGLGRTNDIEELGNSVVGMHGDVPVKISDVALVEIGVAPKLGDASYRGKSAIVFNITKQPDINTIELSDKVKEALESLKKTLPADIRFHTDIFDQSAFIKRAINNVERAIIEGAIFVVIILFLFLMNFRTTIISLIAIPISLLVAIIALKLFGFTINTMSLGGMAIAIGSLVDDAIIDVENVYKRLRENAMLPKEKRQGAIAIIYAASCEIRSSILNATLIIIVAFIPLFFLSGMEGRMLKPLGISFIVALFASLIVAVTLTPVMCSYLLSNEKKLRSKKKGSAFSRFLSRVYFVSLKSVLRMKWLAISIAIGLFAAVLILFFTFGRSFLPPFNEGSLTVNVNTLPGISLEESYKLGKQAEDILLSYDEVITTARKTGRAELAEHSFGVNVSEIDVPFELHERTRAEFVKKLRTELSTISGVAIEVGQPITHRLDHMLSGSKSNIAIKLFGTDLNDMYILANKIKAAVADVEGIADLNVEQLVEEPQIKIRPRYDMLAKFGIPVKNFTRFIDYAFAGEKVSDVFVDDKSFDVVLRFKEESRNSIEAIENSLIDAANGAKVPFYYVASVSSESGPNKINRENVRRKIVISANVEERDLRSVVEDIQEQIELKVKLPDDYRLEYGGQFESEKKASQILFLTSMFSILIIFLILYQEFKNTKLAGVILLNLPLALIGGVLSIWFTSGVVSIPAIIGFITLFGIATRNGILLVSRYQSLREEGHSLYNSILKGSMDRLNPILMTALTAALALLPLAIAGSKPGNEIQSPMAVVILGGLLSSTFLNIFIIPIVYYLLNKKSRA